MGVPLLSGGVRTRLGPRSLFSGCWGAWVEPVCVPGFGGLGAVAVSGLSGAVSVVDAVEELSVAGFVVVPLCGPGPHRHGRVDCARRGKRPLFSGWQHRRVPLSRAEVEEHWPETRGRNVGVSCHGLLVVDCDTREGVDGPGVLGVLFEANGGSCRARRWRPAAGACISTSGCPKVPGYRRTRRVSSAPVLT